MKLPENNGGTFTPAPAGQHNAVLTRFIDLGTQTTNGMYGTKSQRKVQLGWEIPAERVTWNKDGVDHEGPVLHTERMTFSSHEKAIFRQRLESWRGKALTDEDFGTFDCKNLLGVGALLQIVHDNNNGTLYANLNAIMLPPGGKDVWAKPEGPIVYFSLDDFNQEVFDSLTDRMKETIMGSPEYQAVFGVNNQQQNGNHQQSSGGAGYGSGGRPSGDLDDEIPFAPVTLI